MRIRAEWFSAYPTCLAGMQPKLGARLESVTGTVTHIYGDDPVSPTNIEVIVQPDDGGSEVTLKPAWIKEFL